jgi:hypothetical protein
MPEITIDATKAERMLAQILRDDGGLLPSKAKKRRPLFSNRVELGQAALI